MRRWVHVTHTVTADSGVVHDPHQGAELCLLSVAGGPAIELVAGPVVAGVVAKGQTWYHLAYTVPSVPAAVDRLEQERCRLVAPPAPAVLFDGRTVAFLVGPAGLIQLVEA